MVRHTAVSKRWKGRCYGRSDMGLSRAGAAHAKTLAGELAAWQPEFVVHSGLTRTRVLAEQLASLARASCEELPQWRERDFGQWEGRLWSAIYRATGNAMDGMIDDPEAFRPGGGETTVELATRAMSGLRALPTGRVIVVTHGGPIGAIRGIAGETSVRNWPRLVSELGGVCPAMLAYLRPSVVR